MEWKVKTGMELQYENIRIRNAAITDAELLAKWWNDGSVMAHAGFPKGIGTTAKKVAQDIRMESDSTVRRYLILLDEVRIGELVHRQINPRVCEIGIKICDATKQNQGYGKIILSLFLSGLFDCLGYEWIQLDTDLENTRAQHVYESLGFQKLAINHDSWVDQLGRARSSVDYSLSRENFHSYID